jgi:rhodanese-related sulfurtransferase
VFRRPTDRIAAASLHRALKAEPERFVVVDVRTALEFRAPTGRIAGAMSRPWPGTDRAATELGIEPGQTVVLVCLTGHRSRFPMPAFRAANPEATVVDLAGGMLAWWAAGLPVQTGP